MERFYQDENGYVGQPRTLADNAEDVHDAANRVSGRLDALLNELERIASTADDKAAAVYDDPAGYTRHHVATWTAIEKQLALVEDTAAALKLMVEAA